MHEVASKEKNRKKVVRSTNAAKKVEVFVRNMFFPKTVFWFIKQSFIFPGVTGNILEEDIYFIATEDISNNLFLSEFLNARDKTRKLMSYKGNTQLN